MNKSFAPSKSTVYVSNIPFSLTNSDLQQIFEKHGKIAKVTIVKDRVTRQSKGIAFILFSNREDACKCATSLNKTDFFGRIISCSIAKDNGRCKEFIKKKNYIDKSRCYECGEDGHLSYGCPKNALGARDPPKKKKKWKKRRLESKPEEEITSDLEEDELSDLETLGAVIREEQQKVSGQQQEPTGKLFKRKYRQDSYFSDEEEIIE